MKFVVVFEVAIAVVLALGAASLSRAFWAMRRADPGFESAGLLHAEVRLPEGRYLGDDAVRDFGDRLLARLRAVSSFKASALATPLPFTESNMVVGFAIEGVEDTPGARPRSSFRLVSPDYFQTMGIALRRGRAFTAEEDASKSSVVLVNDTFVSRYFSDGEAIGRHIVLDVGNGPESREIIGVVADVHHVRPDQPSGAELYGLLSRSPSSSFFVVVRGADPAALSGSLRAAVRDVDVMIAPSTPRTMDEAIADSLGQPRVTAASVGIFALIALILSASGIYGVVSYAVEQRTREIGIRSALGAQPQHVAKLILGDSLRFGAIGVVFGIGASSALAGPVIDAFPTVEARDPLIYVFTAAAVLALVVCATLIPMSAAIGMQPAAALRRRSR